jgi:hypothetical protein
MNHEQLVTVHDILTADEGSRVEALNYIYLFESMINREPCHPDMDAGL